MLSLRNYPLFWVLLLSTFMTSQVRAQSQDSIKAMDIFNLAKTQIYTQPDSSLLNFELAAELFKKIGHTEYYLYAYNNIANGYVAAGWVDKAAEYLDVLEKEGAVFFGDTSAVYASILYTKGQVDINKGNTYSATRTLQRCIDLYSKRPNLDLQFALYLSYSHQLIAGSYMTRNDLDLAIDHIQRGMRVIEEHFGENQLLTLFELAIAETTLGALYHKKGALSTAKKHFDKSLELFTVELKGKESQIPELISRKGVLYLRLATYYEDIDADSMLHWANLALNLPGSVLKQRPVMAYNRIGLAYQSKGMIPEARAAFKNGIKYLEGVVDYEDSYTYYANSLLHQSKLELEEGNYEEGLLFAQRLLNYFSTAEPVNSFHENPAISTILTYGYDPVYQIVMSKAETFYQIGEEQEDKEQLKYALANYDYVIDLAREIRHFKLSEGAKLQGADLDFQLYEGAIKTALKLHQLTGEPSYIDRAFNYAEQSKAAILQESIDEKVAKGYGEIPDSLLSVERSLRIDIAYFNKAIAEEKRKPAADIKQDRMAEWEEKLFETNTAYYQLIDLFEGEFPRYHALKYQSQYATIKDIQTEALDKGSVLLNFFGGESELYVFVLTKTEKRYYVIEEASELENEVQAFLELIKQPSSQTTQIGTILGQSHSIYKKLLADPLATISGKKSSLIIIPDNWISYLPMETLVASYDPNELDQYDAPSIHYLFEDYTISYDYSGSLLLKNLSAKRKQASYQLFGIAPSFRSPIADVERSCSSDELYSLHCSQTEVQQLNDYYSGINFVGDSATTGRFIQSAADYQIIHLATHACIDSENPMLNKIFFADDYLTNYDLYGLQLNAELAVLSACNTGSGQLIKGEGVMSLSKGFIHAGVPSTVTSLWSVDDCATSNIMTKFYKNLKDGLRKDEALQRARMEYLEAADKAYQHPYYWGAFVHVGNPAALSSGNGRNWPIIIAFGIGAILLGLVVRRKRVV